MFSRSWSALDAGAAEFCAGTEMAAKMRRRREAHVIRIAKTPLQPIRKRFTSGVHGKTSPMREARKFLILAIFLALPGLLSAQTPHPAASAPGAPAWVATWGSSQQIPEPQNALPPDDLRDATVRQIFHLSLGGPALRVHLSNEFGTEALHFTSVHIARPLSPASPSIDATSDRALKFGGNGNVTVPPGAEFVSDPLDYAVAPLSDLAVTFHLDAPPPRETGHPGSRATSYYVHGEW